MRSRPKSPGGWLTDRWHQLSQRCPWWLEVPTVATVGFVSLAGPPGPAGLRDTGWLLRTGLGLISVLSLLGRRRFPATVAGITVIAFFFNPAALWPGAFALYELGLRRRPVFSLALGLAAVASASPMLRAALGVGPVLYGPAAILVVPLVVGLAARNRHQMIDTLHRRIERLRVERELRAEQTRAAERARLAREMHDVLAHRLSLLVLHTGVLELRADELPAPVRQRLGLLRQTSGQALDELRELLGALREPATRAPLAPTSTDLTGLVEESRAAGAEVQLTLSGALGALPTGVQLAVYRVVQECLTNARRHAPGRPVTVAVSRTGTEVTVHAGNPVPPESGAGTDRPDGYGLVGLAERVHALGGTLTAGRGPHGPAADRFEVRAVLPVVPTRGPAGSPAEHTVTG